MAGKRERWVRVTHLCHLTTSPPPAVLKRIPACHRMAGTRHRTTGTRQTETAGMRQTETAGTRRTEETPVGYALNGEDG
jgi:hypothetical protein